MFDLNVFLKFLKKLLIVEINFSYIPVQTAIVPPLTPGMTFAIPTIIPLKKLIICSNFNTVNELIENNVNGIIVGMSELWLERLTHIEENILPTLPSLLKYEEVLANIYIALSVGESALHYLRFIQEETLPSCLTHARLSYLDSFYVLNPLYCKVDHECRDYVELYNAQLIDRQQVLDLLEFKQYSKDELLYMVARLLFPTTFFDYLEELFIAQEWELRYIYD